MISQSTLEKLNEIFNQAYVDFTNCNDAASLFSFFKKYSIDTSHLIEFKTNNIFNDDHYFIRILEENDIDTCDDEICEEIEKQFCLLLKKLNYSIKTDEQFDINKSDVNFVIIAFNISSKLTTLGALESKNLKLGFGRLFEIVKKEKLITYWEKANQ